MKKKLMYLLLVLVLMLLIVSPVLAASSVTITVTNTGSARTMLPISVLMSNSELAAGNFITASGLDVQLSGGIPCMLTDSRTLFASPIGASSTTPFYYTTGNTPATSMPIIVGNGGYVTISDNAVLEPGNNFSITTSGYVDTTAGGTWSISKPGAVQTSIDSTTSGKINASIPSYTNLITVGSAYSSYYSQPGWGQTFTATATGYITQIELNNEAVSFSNIVVGLFSVTGGIGGTLSTLLGQSPATSYSGSAWVAFPLSAPVYVTSGTVYAIAVMSGSGGWTYDNTNPYANGQMVGVAGDDFFFKIDTSPYVSVTGITTGVHTTTTSLAGGTLSLQVDSGVPSTIAFAGSVPDTANNWVFTPGAYTSYYKESVGGLEKLKYQPNTLISGTTLPDLDGTQNGTIIFGNNPAGISTNLGALLATSSSGVAIVTTGSPNLLPNVNVNAKITGGNEGSTFPLYPLFKSLLDAYNSARPGSTPIPMSYFWRLVAAIIAFLFGTGVLIATRSMLYGAIAYGLGLLVPTLWLGGVFDWWVPIFYIIGAVVITMLSTKWTSSSIV
jgi:hypothetical protein